jgi:hypothetical protein
MNLKHVFLAALTSVTLSHPAFADSPTDPLFTPRPNAPTATARVQGSQDTLTYHIVNGMALYTDILLGTHEEVQKNGIRPFQVKSWTADFQSQSKGIAFDNHSASAKRWPNNTVYYKLDPSLSERAKNMIQEGFQMISTKTAVCFDKQTDQADYVHIYPGDGCFSAVGMVGGPQKLSVGVGCSAGNVAHEMLHALGWWHEQMRSDRDNYVTINEVNIKNEFKDQFTKMRPGESDSVGRYDYTSIMHYNSTAFTSNGKLTIEPKPGMGDASKMGQRNALSAGDIASVQRFYPGNICQPELKVAISARELSIDENGSGQLKLKLSGTPEGLRTLSFKLGSSNEIVIARASISVVPGSSHSERLVRFTPVKNAFGEATLHVRVVPTVGQPIEVTSKVTVIDDPSNNGAPPPSLATPFSVGGIYVHGSRVSLNGKNFTLTVTDNGVNTTATTRIAGRQCIPESCTQSKSYTSGGLRAYWVP